MREFPKVNYPMWDLSKITHIPMGQLITELGSHVDGYLTHLIQQVNNFNISN